MFDNEWGGAFLGGNGEDAKIQCAHSLRDCVIGRYDC